MNEEFEDMPRFWLNPDTGLLEQVMPQVCSGDPNPDWRSPEEGEVIGLRGGYTKPIQRCVWRNGQERWEDLP